MSNIYRFTGPPENWITGIGLNKWAVNDNNKGVWGKFEPGDIALLHSTAKSSFSNKTPSAIIGYAVIANKKWIKDDLWWMQEKESGQNLWPYVFTLDEIYLFDEALSIDFLKDNVDKNIEELKTEVEAIASSGIPISVLNRAAKQKDSDTPSFPVNGSASGVNEAYEKLILEEREDFFLHSDSADTSGMVERLDEVLDQELAKQNIDDIRRAAETYIPSGDGYIEKEGVVRVRKDNEAQKRRVARIENYTCQVCGFYCEYTKKNGNKGWIIEIDHIVDKHKGGNEDLSNLWALCPNCHKKKSRGVLKIDTSKQLVTLDEQAIKIKDSHLGWEIASNPSDL